MAFPPGVTIKEFHSEVSQGYPNPKPGGTAGAIPDHHSDRPAGVRWKLVSWPVITSFATRQLANYWLTYISPFFRNSTDFSCIP